MEWTKDSDGHYSVAENGIEFFVYKTFTCPATKIAPSHRWTLEVHGPWYMCRCFPRLFDCYSAAKRVIATLPIMENDND